MRSNPRILLFLNGNRGLELYKELVKHRINIVGIVSTNKNLVSYSKNSFPMLGLFSFQIGKTYSIL